MKKTYVDMIARANKKKLPFKLSYEIVLHTDIITIIKIYYLLDEAFVHTHTQAHMTRHVESKSERSSLYSMSIFPSSSHIHIIIE